MKVPLKGSRPPHSLRLIRRIDFTKKKTCGAAAEGCNVLISGL